jgi:hypothetical protein
MIVNITEANDDYDYGRRSNANLYHTEEIFLPFDGLLSSSNTATVSTNTTPGPGASTNVLLEDDQLNKFYYHQLESACQALHYLYTDHVSNDGQQSVNWLTNLNALISLTLFVGNTRTI